MEVEAADDNYDDGEANEEGGADDAIVNDKSTDQSVQASQAASHT